MSDDESPAIAELRSEITKITAENFAMQLVISALFQTLYGQLPPLRLHILKAFDDAANHAENLSIASGVEAGHLPQALRIIEQLRIMTVGKDKPTREV